MRPGGSAAAGTRVAWRAANIMRLPHAVYDQVLEGLGLDPRGLLDRCDGAGADVPPDQCKRRSFRRRLNRAAYYFPHGSADSRARSCELVDVSRDGVCVMMDRVVAPGERFVLHLPRAADPADGAGDGVEAVGVIALLCTARSSRLKSDGRFRTGAEFTDPTESADEQTPFARAADGLAVRPDTDAVWARAAGLSPREPKARRGDRYETLGVATMHVYRSDGRHGREEHVQLRDYSESGVAILRDEPMKVGDEFVVRVPRGDERPITRLCRVTNVAVAGGRYRIGAQFIPFPGPGGRGLLSRLKDLIA